MKIISTTFLFILLLLLNFQASSESKNSKWVNLFNGKDFSGWHNPYPHGELKVVKGIIELVGNKKFFLAHDKKFSDFTLEAEIKLPEGKANSGFLFRSQKRENGSMFGYQAEVDGSDRKWSGGLYDEGRRGWIHPKKPIENPYNKKNWKIDRQEAFKRNDWNHYKIHCKGDHIQIWVNGIKTTDLKDSTDTKGFIAIQHHGEKGQIYRFKNIKILEL
jgi:hypothetical protein